MHCGRILLFIKHCRSSYFVLGMGRESKAENRSTFWSSFKVFLFLLNGTLTHLNSEFFVLWYLTETYVFWKYHVFAAWINRERKMSICQWPQSGNYLPFRYIRTTFKGLVCVSGISEQFSFMSFLFWWQVYFLFLLFSFLFSFFLVKSIFRFSFTAETLTSTNEEFFLSELSE